MIAKINQLLQEVEALKAANAEELEALRIKYLSKKGAINDLMADFRNVAAEQKKEVGMRLNELKNKAQEKIAALKEQFESQDTGCGACANICPKKVIMIDAGGPRKPVVMCSNQDKGAVANKLCTTSCIACGMCERTCKFDAIHVVDGVARVDYDKCKGCGMCAQKCPKKIILFPLKDDPYPPKPVVKPAAPAAKPAAKPEAKAEEAKPETKAE